MITATLDLETAFLIVNTVVLPAWLLLAVAPRHMTTDALAHSAVFPVAFGLLYAGLMVFAFSSGAVPVDADFTLLEGLTALLKTPLAALIGWVHYLTFDLFVGAWIARDAVRRGVHHGLLVIALFFTLMTGPFGLLIYLTMRWATGKGGLKLNEGPSQT
ncbi:MAG: ABA4-like family protein [Pseudomonadota bacterium]